MLVTNVIDLGHSSDVKSIMLWHALESCMCSYLIDCSLKLQINNYCILLAQMVYCLLLACVAACCPRFCWPRGDP